MLNHGHQVDLWVLSVGWLKSENKLESTLNKID